MDTELIAGAAQGGAGLERLLEAIWPNAYRLAYTVVRDRGLAEDAAQEACATIARSLGTLRDRDRFRAWSYKIVVNCALAATRRRPPTVPLDELPERSIAFDRSDALDLHDALAKLPAVQRAAVVLYYYAGFNSAEIAAATGWPGPTVRFRLMMARRALRAALSDPQHHARISGEVAPHVL